MKGTATGERIFLIKAPKDIFKKFKVIIKQINPFTVKAINLNRAKEIIPKYETVKAIPAQ